MTPERILKFICDQYGWVNFVLVVIIAIFIQCVKTPYKKYVTSKIQDEGMRKLANKVIIVVGFGIAILIQWLTSLIFPDEVEFNVAIALIDGLASNVLYLLGEGVINKTQAVKIINAFLNKDVEVTDEQPTEDTGTSVDTTNKSEITTIPEVETSKVEDVAVKTKSAEKVAVQKDAVAAFNELVSK